MSTTRGWILILLVALPAVLAGCAQEGEEGTSDEDDDQPDDGTGNETGDGDGNETGDGDGGAAPEITSVSVASFNATAAPGDNVTICWQVEGSGTIPHTAVHWDTESHSGDDATFADYQGGAIYPDNTTTQDPAGYQVPGTFCSDLTVPEDTEAVFFRAHAMVAPPGQVSEEEQITVVTDDSDGTT